MSLPIKIDLPSSFFNEEVRDEYRVSEKGKRIWAVELDLLAELLRICKKHDIRVCLFAGSLLGAIRHKGFIPWDDDIDVCLVREEYEKLLQHQDEFKHPYFLQTGYNDREFFLGYARLRNSDTTGIITWNKSKNYNNGIYIDVFVVDGYVDSERLLNKQLKNRNLTELLLTTYYRNDFLEKRHGKDLHIG